MAKLTIVESHDVAPTSSVAGPIAVKGLAWAKCLSPSEYRLRLTMVALEAGGELRWDDQHGDEGLYVLSGGLHQGGRPCPTGGAVVVESGTSTTITAPEATTVAYCSPTSPDVPTTGLYGAPEPEGHSVHVVGDRGWFRSGQQEGVMATWFADSTCPTCRISLFRVDHPSGYAGNLHSHSQDEIIFVLNGGVQLGARLYGPGTAFNIPADVPYRVAYPNGADFLNYRRDVSEQRSGRDGPPRLEGALARGGELVGDLR